MSFALGARRSREAFTIMEVMIAVVIIGILAAIAGPPILKRMRAVNVNSTKSTMDGIKGAIMDFKGEIGRFPNKREGLEILVKKPTTKLEGWDGPYLSGRDEVPQDAWRNDFDYNIGSDIKNKAKYKYFEIISYGADGEPGGEGEDAELTEGA